MARAFVGSLWASVLSLKFPARATELPRHIRPQH